MVLFFISKIYAEPLQLKFIANDLRLERSHRLPLIRDVSIDILKQAVKKRLIYEENSRRCLKIEYMPWSRWSHFIIEKGGMDAG